jgi:hypothetical protein
MTNSKGKQKKLVNAKGFYSGPTRQLFDLQQEMKIEDRGGRGHQHTGATTGTQAENAGGTHVDVTNDIIKRPRGHG